MKIPTVKAGKPREYKVEAVSWELQGFWAGLGYRAGPYKWLTKGLKAIPPSNLIHTGIIVYGNLYEYSTEGVKVKKAPYMDEVESFCKTGKFLGREYLGKTQVPKEEFESWVDKEAKRNFTKANYCLKTKNCCHFALRAASRLHVHPHWEWTRMRYLSENSSFVSKGRENTSSSSNSKKKKSSEE